MVKHFAHLAPPGESALQYIPGRNTQQAGGQNPPLSYLHQQGQQQGQGSHARSASVNKRHSAFVGESSAENTSNDITDYQFSQGKTSISQYLESSLDTSRAGKTAIAGSNGIADPSQILGV